MRSAYLRPVDEKIPDIRTDRGAWYDYWDGKLSSDISASVGRVHHPYLAASEDKSGTLDKEEVVRALLKTLKLTKDHVRR